MLTFIVTECGRISRMLKANNSSQKEKGLVERESSHNIFRGSICEPSIMEDLGNSGPEVSSLRPGSRTKASKNQVQTG